MKFVANDGKIFDTMEECQKYESKNVTKMDLASYWYNNITMLDDEGKIIEPDEDSNNYYYLDHLSNFLSTDNVWFIIVPERCDHDAEWEEICNLFEEEYCVAIPTSSGIWHWYDDEWHTFEDDYKELMRQWKPIKQYLPNLNAL